MEPTVNFRIGTAEMTPQTKNGSRNLVGIMQQIMLDDFNAKINKKKYVRWMLEETNSINNNSDQRLIDLTLQFNIKYLEKF